MNVGIERNENLCFMQTARNAFCFQTAKRSKNNKEIMNAEKYIPEYFKNMNN